MGGTAIEAQVDGPNGTRRFSFLAGLVDAQPNFVGLPLADIEALGLPIIPGGKRRVETGAGVAEKDTYVASVELEGDTAPAMVTESQIPRIGFGVLENLRMKVNPITKELEKAPPDEHMPPYMPFRIALGHVDTARSRAYRRRSPPSGFPPSRE